MTVSPAMWVTGNMASNMSLKETETGREWLSLTHLKLRPQMLKVYILQTCNACLVSFFFCYKLEKENITEVTGLSGLDLCQTPGFNTRPGQSMLEVFNLTKHQRL